MVETKEFDFYFCERKIVEAKVVEVEGKDVKYCKSCQRMSIL